MNESPESVVRAYIAAFGRSVAEDHAAYLRFLADDVRYFSGTTMVHGNRATVEFSKKGGEALGLVSWRAEISNLAVDRDTVLCERIDYQIDEDGNEAVVVPIMGIFKVSGGKITEWRDYWDPRPLIAFGTAYRARKGLPAWNWGDAPGGAAMAALAAAG